MGRFKKAAAELALFSVVASGAACTNNGEIIPNPTPEATATALPKPTGEACGDAATDVEVISGLGGAAVKFQNTGQCFEVYIGMEGTDVAGQIQPGEVFDVICQAPQDAKTLRVGLKGSGFMEPGGAIVKIQNYTESLPEC